MTLFAVAVIAFAVLVPYELRRDQPLIEVRFFGSAPFAGASAIALFAFAGLGGFLFLNTLYLQEVRGLSPLDAGLYVLPLALATVVIAPISGRMVSTRGTRLPLVGGGIGLIVGGLMLTGLTTTTSYPLLIASYTIYGAGFGLVNPPITNTAVSGMPPSQAGVAAAIASTSRQVGFALGVAVLGSLAAGAAAENVGPSFAAATHASWWVVVGLGVAALCLGFVTSTGWARETARHTARRLNEEPLETGLDSGDAGTHERGELVAG